MMSGFPAVLSDALEDMLVSFNEYMAGGFSDDCPKCWNPMFV